jgi:CRISPR-associated protein Cst1
LNINEIKENELVGDPFVDAGLVAIRLLAGKEIDSCSNVDLEKISGELIELYLTPAWSKEIQSIFPNSTYIQSARKYDKQGKSKNFLLELIQGVNGLAHNKDHCLFCGRHTFSMKDNKPFFKTQVPLVGSSDFLNFFPSFGNGVGICARCALALQFSPILFYKVGGKPTCVSFSRKQALEEYGKECVDQVRKNKLLGKYGNKESSGLFDEGYKSPQTALFHLADKVWLQYKKMGYLSKSDEIVIYKLDNYNQNPRGIEVFKLPNNVFNFVIHLNDSPEYREIWQILLRKYYSREEEAGGEGKSGKTKNKIFEYLVRNESILWAFRDKENKKVTVPWEIVEYYVEKVRNMNKQRIESIKNLGDKIAECVKETNNKKRVNGIVSARDFPAFRNQLGLVAKDWQKLRKEKSMLTFEEYVSALNLENGYGWKEVQDLITIRLFEKLHDMLSGDESEGNDIEEAGDDQV